MSEFTLLEKRILDEFQRDLPLSPMPYAAMAEQLGVSEEDVLRTLESLQRRGVVSRVGAVFRPKRLGASALAAMTVPQERMEEVAALVNGYREVNHNYEREHPFNLWFVVTAHDERRLAEVLEDIARRTGLAVMDLPLVEDYHIDLGFRLWR
jgi:DNA-binding Lrp family transcriptional regulator